MVKMAPCRLLNTVSMVFWGGYHVGHSCQDLNGQYTPYLQEIRVLHTPQLVTGHNAMLAFKHLRPLMVCFSLSESIWDRSLRLMRRVCGSLGAGLIKLFPFSRAVDAHAHRFAILFLIFLFANFVFLFFVFFQSRSTVLISIMLCSMFSSD
jgi:hypothetical protein